MIGGPEEVSIANFKMMLATNFLAKGTGELRPGLTVRFISRNFVHEGTHHREASQELHHERSRGLRPREVQARWHHWDFSFNGLGDQLPRQLGRRARTSPAPQSGRTTSVARQHRARHCLRGQDFGQRDFE
eukprot:3611246-Alexandrium_andersonii.AAC.1